MLEANPRRAGGALGTEALTLPGFRHDVGGGFFPFGASSPAFRELDLVGAGVEWRHARYESCHPAVDGSFACIARGDALDGAPFGGARDADAFRELARVHAGRERELLDVLLGPVPERRPARRGSAPATCFEIARMFVAQRPPASRRACSRARPRAACCRASACTSTSARTIGSARRSGTCSP